MRADRRQALRLLALGGGGLLWMGCGAPGASADAGAAVDLAGAPVMVPLADVPVSALIVKGTVVIGHDAGGYYAMSAVCTHEGCIVMPGSDSTCVAPCALACPCHGARYDGNGVVVHGPATVDLVHYLVTLTADSLIVDPTMTVPAATRA
jgi:Rieske Fe-S protein